MDEGNVPVAPSLYFSDFVNEKNVLDRSTAKKMTHRLLLACEEVYVFGDKTKEMKEILEEAQAEAMKITDVPLW
jgi:hypothetical protein